MRLISFRSRFGASWGAVIDAGIVDLQRLLPNVPSLKAALEAGALPACAALLDRGPAVDFLLQEVELEPVIPDPGHIICIGLNYESHRLETQRDRASYPTVFSRTPASQTGHLRPILLPPESVMLDFEGELAVIVGQRCRRVAVDHALAVVAGYACYNDSTIRDFQRHTMQFHPGKNWPATGAFGPWLVTADEIADPTRLSIETRLNGVVVQSADLHQLIFSIPELIAYCSTWTELRPGDVIVTGTPGGVGSTREPPLWMKHGDNVEVAISEIGVLRNTIERESPP